MPDSALPPAVAWAVAGIILLVALAIYGAQIRRIRRDGGKVNAGSFDLPELLMSIVFASFFTFLTICTGAHAVRKEPTVKVDSVLPEFINLHHFHRRDRWVSCAIAARSSTRSSVSRGFHWSPCSAGLIGLLAAAFPILQAANELAGRALRGNVEPQPLVDLFNSAVQHHDYRTMGIIFVSAVMHSTGLRGISLPRIQLRRLETKSRTQP